LTGTCGSRYDSGTKPAKGAYMNDDLEQSPAGSQPYWVHAARIVNDIRALADEIEATIEPGKLTSSYGPVVDLLDETLGDIEQAALEVDTDDPVT
jgi:hypothetical protein